ncbi:hypothetical protein MPC38_20915 [Prescottella equi]|uniref:hypothetical protein n=1 Tax=Rhodococcus hoagii TaxID=43767 RepID=UPI001F5B4DDC|nr:hypothetical protein [Prescottella equi]UNQ39118.1 hypothetical protein MPC38_20915 [Prescottella equi]
MTASRRRAKPSLCRIPIAFLATAAGAGTVGTIAAFAEQRCDLSIPLAACALVALLLGAMQITFCSGNGMPLPATEQERADISGKNRPTGLSGGPAADSIEKGPEHG